MSKAKVKKLGTESQKKAKGGQAVSKRPPSQHADGVVADPKVKGKFRIASKKEIAARQAACWHMYGCPFCSGYSAAPAEKSLKSKSE